MALDDWFKPPTQADLAPATPALAPQVAMRDIGDAAATRQAIFDKSLHAASNMPPIANATHSLRLTNVGYTDAKKPVAYSPADQTQAVLEGRTLGRKLQGTWELSDVATGNVLSRKRAALADVPWLHDDGTFVIRGNSYSLGNQLRQDAGVFARERGDGALESHFNVLPGHGLAHRVILEPETGIFRMRVGQAMLPLYSVLRGMGVSHEDLHNTWGRALADANRAKDDPKAIDKMYAKLFRTPEVGIDHAGKTKAVAEKMMAMKLDPFVTEHTLGEAHETIQPRTYLLATKKLLDISHGKAKVDDRDSPAYQTLHGPEDLISERFGKDRAGLRKLLWRAALTKNVNHIPSYFFQKGVASAIQSSGVGTTSESINPSMLLDQLHRVTKLGEGGISGGVDAIPDEARSVQAGQTGFIDLVTTAESESVGIDGRIASRVKKGDDNRMYAPFIDVKTGEEVYKSPRDLLKAVVAPPGEMQSGRRWIKVLKNNRMTYAKPSEVDYVLSDMEGTFAPLDNLVPMKSAMKGQRSAMAQRMTGQALALVNPEAPFVRTGSPDGDSYERKLSKYMGAVHAEGDGTVRNVTEHAIEVAHDDGTTKTHPIQKFLPFNRKSVVGSTTIWICRDTVTMQLAICDYRWQIGDKVLSVDPLSKRSVWLDVHSVIKHRNDKRLLRVVMASGRDVIVTVDHSLVTMGSDGALTPILPLDCVIDRTRVPVAMLVLPVVEAKAGDLDRGRIIGLYLAEGYCPPSKDRTEIAVEPFNRATEVIELARRVSPNRQTEGTTGKVYLHNAALNILLRNNFGHLAHNKRIAPWVFNASEEFRRGVLEGYMAGDGCLWADGNDAIQVGAVSVSRGLRDDMVALLSSLGVFATVFDVPLTHMNANWRDGYGFRIVSQDLAKLPRVFFYEDREVKFRKLLQPKRYRSNFALVPVDTKDARRLLYSGAPKPKTAEFYSRQRRVSRSGYIAKDFGKTWDGPFGDWCRSDVMWDKIVAVLPHPHEEFVYDLCVPGSEVFAVNHGTVVHNTGFRQTPMVQQGQRIQKGQLLAKSNYTDDEGTTALGANLRTAWMPWMGYGYEDANVVSESAAKKLTSEHVYQHAFEPEDGLTRSRKAFIALYPSKWSKQTLAAFDDTGLPKVGTILKHGDPIWLAVRERQDTGRRLHGGKSSSWSDASEVWDHDTDGEVVAVANTPKGANVVVRTLAPLKVGDKLAGRHGNKGVVAEIVPDHQMPHDADGKPYEVMFNPLGTISRGNPAAALETWLGKIVEKTGRKPYNIADFGSIPDLHDYVGKEMQRAGVTPHEHLYDPLRGGAVIPDVMTGNTFWMKLHHTANSKIQGRGVSGYTSEGRPAKGGFEGCFPAPQLVRTAFGAMPIGRIVEKRLGVPVLTFSEQLQEWVYRPITDWFVYRAKVADIVVIDVSGPCLASKNMELRASEQSIYPTKNHEMLMFDGTRALAGSLKVGDMLTTFGQVPTQDQMALMLGSLLGDASISASGFSVTHSIKQVNYVDWKKRVLSGLCPKSFDIDEEYHPSAVRYDPCFGRIRRRGRCVYVNQPHVWRELHPLCIDAVTGKKTASQAWLARLTDLSIAVWVLDDGFIGNRAKKAGKVALHGSLAIHGFDSTSKQTIKDWLTNRFAAYCSITEAGCLYLSPDICWKLVEVIARNVPWQAIPKSKRWLLKHVRKQQESKAIIVRELATTCSLGKVPLFVTGVRPYVHPKPGVDELSVYDFTVADTHTYCAGSALVSNSKKVSLLNVNAMLSHGALANIRDAVMYRGQAHPDFWRRFLSGHSDIDVANPQIHHKFIATMQAAGINPSKIGSKLRLLALTNKDVDHLAEGRELENGETLDWGKKMAPIPGGLFDPKLGTDGSKWSSIKLAEPLLNPIMEEPARKILGLTEAKFRDVLAGRESFAGRTGPEAIATALKNIDVPKEMAAARAIIASGRKTYRDLAQKKLGYLKGCHDNDLHPGDWVLDRVPVLPPKFRPVSLMQKTKIPLVADANLLYRDLFETNQHWKSFKDQIDDVGDERLATYDALKAVVGLGDPVQPKTLEKNAKGMLRILFGSSPKHGYVQSKLIGSSTDLVGRAVVVPDPKLNMDEIGLPETSAWTMYRPFVIRELVRNGMDRVRAIREVADQTPLARKTLVGVTEKRPIVADRAPVLHRYSVMAFKPKLTSGDVLRMPVQITAGMGMDFDGNCCSFYTEVCLEFDWAVLYASIDDATVASAWKEQEMRLTGSSSVIWRNEQRCVVRGPIGEFPRVGIPVKDRNGASVYKLPLGVKIFTYDHASGKAEFREVTHFTVDPPKACSLVETRFGHSVTVTNNESLVAFKHSDGTIEKIKPDDCVGRLVPVVRRLDLPDAGEFDRDLGWWYASLAADGWVTESGRTVGYSKGCDARRARFAKIACDRFPGKFVIHEYCDTKANSPGKYGDSAKLHLNSAELVKVLFSVYVPRGKGRGALYKKLPDELLLRGNHDCLLGMLSGALDGDATIGWNTVKAKPRFYAYLCTSSPSLLASYRLLCRRLGIRHSISSYKPSGRAADAPMAYMVTLSVVDLHPLVAQLQLVSPERQAMLDEFAAGPAPTDRRDWVPLIDTVAKKLQQLTRRDNEMQLYDALARSKNGYTTRTTALRLLTFAEKYPELNDDPLFVAWQQLVRNQAIGWDIYETATPEADQETFDFYVPSTKVFVVDDGLVIYDTAQFHVPLSDAAAEEAMQKMLPSKNLFAVSNFRAHQLPSKEFLVGLYQASTLKNANRRAQVFRRLEDVEAAFARGELSAGDPIEILR